jgi:hypothetical protein
VEGATNSKASLIAYRLSLIAYRSLPVLSYPLYRGKTAYVEMPLLPLPISALSQNRLPESNSEPGESSHHTQISTFYEPGDEEADVPPAKRCENSEETWSFNFANGEIKRIANSEPLQIFKKFVSSRDKH